MLYISHREKETKVLGPGKRYAIWLQGCRKHCKGCLFPEGRVIGKNGYWIIVDDIIHEIEGICGLTGITISGGEPFLQARALATLVKQIRLNTNLDIMIYSGYTLKELLCWNNDSVNYIINNIDILVDGEYVDKLNNNSIYRGSDNQIIHFLSSKYKQYEETILKVKNRSLEFVLRNDDLFIVGIPARDFDTNFFKEVLKNGG